MTGRTNKQTGIKRKRLKKGDVNGQIHMLNFHFKSPDLTVPRSQIPVRGKKGKEGRGGEKWRGGHEDKQKSEQLTSETRQTSTLPHLLTHSWPTHRNR